MRKIISKLVSLMVSTFLVKNADGLLIQLQRERFRNVETILVNHVQLVICFTFLQTKNLERY